MPVKLGESLRIKYIEIILYKVPNSLYYPIINHKLLFYNQLLTHNKMLTSANI